MIISQPYRFLFVANLRTASSSIHEALAPLATASLAHTAAGKHLSLTGIHDRFGPERVAPLFAWAVIREPVSYLWSLYTFHKQPGFDGRPITTRGRSFEEFCFGDTHRWMLVPQSSRFAGPDGEFGLDLLIRYEHLSAGFSYVKFRLGLPNLLLRRLNVGAPSPARVPASLAERIREDYAADYECIARYGDRERSDARFVQVLRPAPAMA
jgi:hypothetical protein